MVWTINSGIPNFPRKVSVTYIRYPLFYCKHLLDRYLLFDKILKLSLGVYNIQLWKHLKQIIKAVVGIF